MSLDIMSAVMASLRTRFVSDSLHALVSRLKPSRFRNFLHRAVCFFTGHPVDIASGKVMTEFIDVELPGPLPLKVERIYSSAFAHRDGPLGHGWHLSLDQAIWRERGKVVLLAEDGREIEFDTFDFLKHRIQPGQRVYNPIERLTLYCDLDGAWRIVDHRCTTRHFAPVPGSGDGRAMLQKVVSRCGYHEIAFRYGTEGATCGRLESVQDCGDRVLHLVHDLRGRVTALHLPQPQGEGSYQHRRYEYDAAGDLVRVTDALGHVWRFTYVTHLLTQETDRNGLSFYFQYDGLGGDAWCVRTWGDGGIHDHVLRYDKQKHVSFVTNSCGHTTQYHMNLIGQVVKIVAPTGGETVIDYDPISLRRTSKTDPSGAAISLTYTSTGHLLEIGLPNSGGYLFEYTQDNCPSVLHDGTGATWTWRHNPTGLPVERCDPTGYRVVQTWEKGLVKRTEDSLGRWVELGYDRHLNLSDITYSDGKNDQWLHDHLGRIVMATGTHGQTKRFWYDGEGNLLHTAEGENVRSYEYDDEGRLIRARGPDRDVQFEYCGLNLVHRVQAGTITRIAYDSEGQVAAVHSPMGHVHRYVHDFNGDVVEEVSFDGQQTRYVRDPCGRIVKRTAPSGAETHYSYDPTGLVTRIDYTSGQTLQLTHDEEGRVTRATLDETTVELTRDVLGRVISERTGEHSVTSKYGQLGRRIQLSSSLGLSFTIDRDQRDRPTTLSIAGTQTDFAWSWGPRGQIANLELPGAAVHWRRDGYGRPTYQALRSSQASRGLEYSWAPGHRLTSIRSSTRTRQFGHDALGGLAWSRDDDEPTKHRTLDVAGNVVYTPTSATQIHDAMGRVIEARHSDGRVITYEYDADGQLVCKREGEGPAWELRWNGDGTLAAVMRPDGREVSFTYDAFGRRTHKRFDSIVTRWIWDGDVPLHEWCEDATANGGSGATYERLITWLFQPESHVPLAKLEGGECHSIITDYQGAPILMVDESGEVIWAAESDLLGKLNLVEGQRMDCPFRLPGQFEDEETGLHYNRFRYYDPDCGSYISADPLGFQNGPSPYTYARDPIHERDPYGLKFLFRGDDFYSGGPVGRPLGSDADITTAWEHVRRKSNETSIFTSFAEDRKSAAKFTDGNNIYKVDLDRIRQLEADGVIKTYTPDEIFDMMRNSADTKIRRDASNVRDIMRKNKEILVEGQIPEDDVKKCR